MNKWKSVILYLNSKFNKTFTLVDMEVDLNHISAKDLASTFMKLGHIKKIADRKYRGVKKIPENLGYTKARQAIVQLVGKGNL